jgi:hypothetical protein
MNKINNEWILSKPTPMGNIEQWRFVRLEGTDKIALYHKLENGIEYAWSDSMSLEQGRDTWQNIVQNGFNFNREKIAEVK